MELFDSLKDINIWDAQIVGKNLFCKSPESPTCFGTYFDFCIKVSQYPVEIETRSFFLKEAELALNVFSERVDMTEETLSIIQNKRNELIHASSSIHELLQENEATVYDNHVKANNKTLVKLSKLKGDLLMVDTRNAFEKILAEIAVAEKSLDKSLFTDEQVALYDELTREYSNAISKKMADLSHAEDVKYNKDAAQAFRKAFVLFKSDEDKYKARESNLYELVSKYLFAYDAKRLFSETLIYYNHVYSYIFNKLDDDGKYRFTQFSFDAPKTK